MIYIIIGGSCSGKTFVYNSFIRNKKGSQCKDILPYYETNEKYILGVWNISERTKGTDRINRKDIKFISEQIKRLYNKGDKDIVIEGDKIISHDLFYSFIENHYECKMLLMKIPVDLSISRNKKNNSTNKNASLKASCTRAENIFYKFQDCFKGEEVNTTNVKDFTNFDITNYKEFLSNSNNNSDFAVFILTHGRPDNVITVNTLKKCGYTGKYYIVIDNEDSTENEYRKLYADKVILFDKKAISKTFDTFDLSEDRRTIVYARNVCFDIAKKMGLKYFLELDDDYTSFEYRFVNKNKKNRLDVQKCKNLDKVFDLMINFLKDTKVDTVCFAQGGDFIGGLSGGNFNKKVLRKTMNSFFCDVQKPFQFIGRINEDVNTYCLKGSVGWLGLSITDCSLVQKRTQTNKGGMSGVYLDSGTYLKSFYTVMCMPSAVSITLMGDKHLRLHHNINWNCCVPKIINEKYKK